MFLLYRNLMDYFLSIAQGADDFKVEYQIACYGMGKSRL